MNGRSVVQLHIQISQRSARQQIKFQARWKILFQLFSVTRLRVQSKSIIKIGPRLIKVVKIKKYTIYSPQCKTRTQNAHTITVYNQI